MKTRRIGVSLGSLVLVGAVAVAVGQNDDGGITVEQAAESAGFDLYWVGEEFDGLPLTTILAETGSVDFLYGDCHATSDQGCGLPLDIQVWPACVRNLAELDVVASALTTVRGAQVAVFNEEASEPTSAKPAALESMDDIGHLEVYTGDVTVVLFGYPTDRLLLAVDALRLVDNQADPATALPPPVEGAVEGTLSCSAADDDG